ncbi:hypothetical protein Trydic_g21300 [Trypoxylus dichotomus]
MGMNIILLGNWVFELLKIRNNMEFHHFINLTLSTPYHHFHDSTHSPFNRKSNTTSSFDTHAVIRHLYIISRFTTEPNYATPKVAAGVEP